MNCHRWTQTLRPPRSRGKRGFHEGPESLSTQVAMVHIWTPLGGKMTSKSWRGVSVVLIRLTAMFAPASASAHGNPPPDKTLAPTTRFSVPFPDHDAVRQAVDLLRHHHLQD